MDRRNKIILAVIVVAMGVVLASQFRKIELAKSHSPDSPQWHDSAQATAQQSADNSSPQTWQRPTGATAFDGHIEPAPGDSATQTGSDAGADSAHPPTNTDATTTGFSPTVSSTASPAGPMVDLNTPEQTHKIVDGDTLQNIAQRYLGRPERYLELFQYNRDVLRSPDVLPIGAELRIPSHVALPTGADASAPPTAPSTPLTPLVPLPAAQPPAAAAKSALPVSAQRINPRTYTVQPGDNVVDLARRFYGDGRQYETIYEANRRVMHNPTDLRPGMVLVMP